MIGWGSVSGLLQLVLSRRKHKLKKLAVSGHVLTVVGRLLQTLWFESLGWLLQRLWVSVLLQ